MIAHADHCDICKRIYPKPACSGMDFSASRPLVWAQATRPMSPAVAEGLKSPDVTGGDQGIGTQRLPVGCSSLAV